MLITIQAFVQSVIELWNESLPGKTLNRFNQRRGSLLAGGLAYGLLFAFFAGVWVALSIAGLVVSGNEQLSQSLINAINSAVPSTEGIITADVMRSVSTTLTWTGLVTIVMFFWTVVGWMNSLRSGVHAMFDSESDAAHPIVSKAIDALAVVGITVLLMASTTAGAVSGGVIRSILTALNIDYGGFFTSVAPLMIGFAVAVLLNYVMCFVLIRAVGHVTKGGDVHVGSLIGGMAITIMQLLGTRLLTGASKNPLLVPFAAVLGVLIWFNLMCQVFMVVAAIIAQWRTHHTITGKSKEHEEALMVDESEPQLNQFEQAQALQEAVKRQDQSLA